MALLARRLRQSSSSWSPPEDKALPMRQFKRETSVARTTLQHWQAHKQSLDSGPIGRFPRKSSGNRFRPRSWYRPRFRFQTPPRGFQPWNPAEAPDIAYGDYLRCAYAPLRFRHLRWERRSQTHAREPDPWTHIFVRCALFSGGRYHDRGLAFVHQLVVAAQLCFGRMSQAGIRPLNQFLRLSHLDRVVMASHGAQQSLSTLRMRLLESTGFPLGCPHDDFSGQTSQSPRVA